MLVSCILQFTFEMFSDDLVHPIKHFSVRIEAFFLLIPLVVFPVGSELWMFLELLHKNVE